MIRELFPGILKEAIEQSIDIKKLIDAVLLMQEKIVESEINSLYSGSTFCGILISNGFLYSINSGDSRAVLYSDNIGKNSWNPLTKDHKPDDSAEFLRIVSSGGKVERPRGLILNETVDRRGREACGPRSGVLHS